MRGRDARNRARKTRSVIQCLAIRQRRRAVLVAWAISIQSHRQNARQDSSNQRTPESSCAEISLILCSVSRCTMARSNGSSRGLPVAMLRLIRSMPLASASAPTVAVLGGAQPAKAALFLFRRQQSCGLLTESCSRREWRRVRDRVHADPACGARPCGSSPGLRP